MKHPRLALGVLLLALAGSFPATVRPQGGDDEQGRLLQVRRRQIELKEARVLLSRTEELFRQGLVPKADVERNQGTVERAQLDYQEALLTLLNVQPRVSVKEAVKFQTPDGRKSVRLTVTNLSPTFDDSQFRLLSNFEGADPIPKELKTRKVRDLFISLKDPGGGGEEAGGPPRGTTIALPYEVHIPDLSYGKSRSFEFQLLRDVDSVIVVTTHKGQQREIDVQLQQAETDNLVTLSSNQISQEADLGSQATFDLRLERATVDGRIFQLKVLNLPRPVSYSFLDPKSQARLSQINFSAGVTQQALSLRLFLPERSDEEVRLDRPIEFWVVVTRPESAGAFREDRRYSPEELARQTAGQKAGLWRGELIPRGVGRIEVLAPSLFSEIQRGERFTTRLNVHNSGSRRLDNVQLTTEPPPDWRLEVTPKVIPALGINQEQAVELQVFPPPDVSVGDYEIRIKTESFAYNRRVPSEDKIYRVSVTGKGGTWTTVTLLGGLLTLVVGMVVVGAKLANR